MSTDQQEPAAWRHESDVYAQAGQEQPAWAASEPLGLCPMVCVVHARHCAYPLPHDLHGCSLCDGESEVTSFGDLARGVRVFISPVGALREEPIEP